MVHPGDVIDRLTKNTGGDSFGPTEYNKFQFLFSRWITNKYVVLQVDVSSTNDDEDLANIATHYPSGDSFSWDEFNSIIFVTDIQHPTNYELKYNSVEQDAEPFVARGQEVNHVGIDGNPITKIYLTNTSTSADNVIIKLEGY